MRNDWDPHSSPAFGVQWAESGIGSCQGETNRTEPIRLKKDN